MLHLKALIKFYVKTVCIKPFLEVLPVKGWWMSLSLTAKHHLSAVLSRLKGKHHTAGLFGELRPQQDSTSWVENQQNYISFDVLVSLKTNFHIFLLASTVASTVDIRLTDEETTWKNSAAKEKVESQ